MIIETILYVLIFVIVIVGAGAGALKVIRIMTKRKLRITTPNGIQISEKVMIGGIPQWIQIRGEDRSNPVLFFLHGGPGGALMNISHFYQREWEKHFTVVNWDQRASGKTRFESDPEEVKKTVTMSRMIEDAREVAEYLRKRIGNDRIIVLGQSWGSALGTQVVLKYPELFAAYIGTGQAIDARRNFQTSLERMLTVAEESGDTELHEKLIKIKQQEREGKFTYYDMEFQKVYGAALRKYGVASYKYRNHPLKLMFIFLWSMLNSPENTVREVLQRRFKKKNTTFLFLDFCKSPEYDTWKLEEIGTTYAVPFYQINGDKDWQTPFLLAKEYYDRVEAPRKRWFLLKDAGHATQLDNLPDFTRYLLEIREDLGAAK